MRREHPIIGLVDVATVQWGLFTTAQARAVGFSAQRVSRLAGTGAIDRVRHGVYRVGGAPSVQDEQLRAAWLAIEPSATAGERLNQEHPGVVSHRSAARAHGLGDLDADIMEFMVASRKQSRLNDVRYRVASLDRDRWTLVDGLPVTTILATIDDLASDHLDGGHLASIVRDALTSGRADADAIADVLRAHAHRYGAPLGDGSGLVNRFLVEAGIPSSMHSLNRHLTADESSATATSVTEIREAIARQTAPLQEAIDRLTTSPTFQEALARQTAPLQEAIDRLTTSPTFQEALARQTAPLQEAIDRLTTSPTFQEALARQTAPRQEALARQPMLQQKETTALAAQAAHVAAAFNSQLSRAAEGDESANSSSNSDNDND
ncbi:type IV toxin-antitoxin system AbiEi family antitoxin domain-containing protein [Rhodococcus sp. G-MC3]|uniref:type IV toxin-antitoxin system AbiEi family antitoxin domain-containing protein n=1 Tax=Rhodococcus sp. G-MC3 TaxID=3046209 RepID=UPI0024B8CF4F|nr:type IV toxin-antitoxin system AbiEi family antitoxin domain-containing protein [Rhodococcus sp. G-MC3]MDJ0394237.1 type IV toxin-antitoxin system AbiEi family antitoxin domain-containing protein [Rhodococcus sp. G-MC3]